MRPRPALRIAAVALALTAPVSAQGPQPTFRSGIDLIRLDVQVVADDGTPVGDLTENDFEIRVDGKPAPVRTLRFLDLTSRETPSIELTSADVSTNAAPTRGRLTVIVIDEDNLPDDTLPLMEGLRTYLKGLGPSDQAALVVLPRPGIWQDFTHDTGALGALLKRSSSRADRDVNRNDLAGSIPVEGAPADPFDQKRRIQSGQVASDRGEFAAPLFNAQSAADPKRDLIYALEELARRLRGVEGPKTLLLVSTGLPDSITLDDYHAFADEAARARLTVYVLKPPPINATASSNTSALEKQFQAQNGLDFLAGMTGGVVLNAVGNARGVFDRVTRETSGSYVIGVEPPAGAPRNKSLAVTVTVKRTGLTVRSRQQVSTAAPGSRQLADPPKQTLGTLLHDPRLATDLPLRVTSYTARGVDRDRVKTLIVAELNSSTATEAVWGFEVRDGQRVISDAFDKVSFGTLAGEPVVTSASLPPGNYTMRFGMVDDQGHRASVDRPLSLGLHAATTGDLEFSDVFAGVAAGGHFKPRITVDAGTGQIIALLEVYGASREAFDNVIVEFALHGEDGAHHATTRARVQPTANSGVPKGIAQGALQLGRAEPGRYTVSAALLLDGKPAGSTRRELMIGPAR
jgi:VWFA-related protein